MNGCDNNATALLSFTRAAFPPHGRLPVCFAHWPSLTTTTCIADSSVMLPCCWREAAPRSEYYPATWPRPALGSQICRPPAEVIKWHSVAGGVMARAVAVTAVPTEWCR